MKKLLERLIKTPCVPQFQKRMIDFLEEEIDFAEVETDHLGNVHLTSESSGKEKVTLLAHLNEIGFAVERIEDSGFLRFQNISEVDERTLLGQRMMIYGGGEGVRGVVGAKPPHLLRGEEEAEKKIKVEDMFIDVGAYSREQAEEMGIGIGDPVVLEGWLRELPDGRLVGKSLDDRAGVFVVIETLRSLFEEGEEDISAWLLSQETSFPKDFGPDYAVSIDTTLAGPYPPEKVQVERHEIPIEVGGGPALTLREENASISQKVRNLLDNAAKEAGVELQVEATSRAEDRRINPMERDVPSAIISLPVKYLRTPGEIASIDDLEEAIDVIKEFCREVEE